jgi:hypothetical protein
MVTRYGMSEKLGSIAYNREPGNLLAGPDRPYPAREREYAEETAAAVDHEVRAIIDRVFQRAQSLLKARRAILDRAARTLLEKKRSSRATSMSWCGKRPRWGYGLSRRWPRGQPRGRQTNSRLPVETRSRFALSSFAKGGPVALVGTGPSDTAIRVERACLERIDVHHVSADLTCRDDRSDDWIFVALERGRHSRSHQYFRLGRRALRDPSVRPEPKTRNHSMD